MYNNTKSVIKNCSSKLHKSSQGIFAECSICEFYKKEIGCLLMDDNCKFPSDIGWRTTKYLTYLLES